MQAEVRGFIGSHRIASLTWLRNCYIRYTLLYEIKVSPRSPRWPGGHTGGGLLWGGAPMAKDKYERNELELA